jgi:hypothetical protein
MKNLTMTTLILLTGIFAQAKDGGGTVGSADLRAAALAASDYGVCNELKIRSPRGDEAQFSVNCGSIIASYELQIEKKALLKRLGDINSELKKIEASKVVSDK